MSENFNELKEYLLYIRQKENQKLLGFRASRLRRGCGDDGRCYPPYPCLARCLFLGF